MTASRRGDRAWRRWQTCSSSSTTDAEPRRAAVSLAAVPSCAGSSAAATRTASPRASRRSRSPGSATSASAARPARGAARSPGWSARRLDWKVYDHELLEAIAQRMEVPDRRGPRLRRAGAERRPGLDLAAPRGALRPAGGLSRPPGQAGRGDRPGGRVDHRRPRGGLPAAARDDALGPDHRPAEGPRRAAGRADGRLGPDRPPGRPRPRPPPHPVRPHDAPGRPDRPAQLRPRARLEQPGPGRSPPRSSSAPSRPGCPPSGPTGPDRRRPSRLERGPRTIRGLATAMARPPTDRLGRGP